MRLPLALALAALLAGCAGEPPALVAGEPTFSDADVPAGRGFATLRWTTLAEGTGALTPATPIQSAISVPLGTVTTSVNLTTEQGAASGLLVTLGECHWRRDVTIVGIGQELAADCGGVLDGSATLLIGIDAGALVGSWRVVALTCDAREGACPGRAPVPSA